MTEATLEEANAGTSALADDVASSAANLKAASNAQRQAFLRSASVPTLEKTAPKLVPRWLHAEGKTWTAFSPGDSQRLEDAHKTQSSEQTADPAPQENTKDAAYEAPEPDATVDSLPTWRVPVGQDRLFDVDLRRRGAAKMSPVFWKGPALDVRRGEWFFESSRIAPCEAALSQELEDLYHAIRPWTSAYAEELKASASIGAEGEEKLMCRLKSLKGSYCIFSGTRLARIYQEGVSTRLTKTLLTAWSGEHGGGTVVVRGYDQLQQLMRARKGDNRRKRRSGIAGPAATVKDSPSKPRASGSDPSHQGGTESPLPAGAARPDPPNADGASQTQTAPRPPSTDLWTSLASRLGSWNSGSAAVNKVQEDLVAESFKEAQSKVQEIPSADDSTLAADAAAEEDEEEEVLREREAESEEIELVFAWHGIGQRLAEDWKNLEFSLAVNALKDLVRKRSKNPAPSPVGGAGLPSLTKGKRLIFVPINWRATLNDFKPTKDEVDEDEHEDEHLDNVVDVDDLFGASDSIPLARQVTKNLLLDIPMYLSHHRAEVLRRAIMETNRAYALFCQRHPTFRERGGKISMICHSLGCAMACDVLSKQPTRVDKDLGPADAVRSPHLAFDVRSLYLCGSPAALFFYLGSRQLIARRGRGLTRDDGRRDEALNRNVWGCLAVDRIFNVINTTDPLATHLNGCVDSKAKASAVAMDRAVNCILATLPGANPSAVAPQATTAGAMGLANAASTSATAASTFFGNWSTMGKSASGEGTDDGSATPPADLEETIQPRKNKGEGNASMTKAKARQWAAKLAQSRGVAEKKGGEPREKESGSEESAPAPSTVEPDTAAKTQYRPAPATTEPALSDAVATSADAQSRGNLEPSPQHLIKSDVQAGDDAARGTDASAHGHDKDVKISGADSQDRARRRFLALNPLGRIDYVMPKPANWIPTAMLEYVQMLQSHANYWYSETFADFIIATAHLEDGDERWVQARRLLHGGLEAEG
ncbi:unnamed protein product [Parajaminaea phylloscopi]